MKRGIFLGSTVVFGDHEHLLYVNISSFVASNNFNYDVNYMWSTVANMKVM